MVAIVIEHLLYAWVGLTNSKSMMCLQCDWHCSKWQCVLSSKGWHSPTCSEDADKAQMTVTHTRSHSPVRPRLSPGLHTNLFLEMGPNALGVTPL